ncbi:putative membrane protein [Parabacteroides distasonis str. 3999B T(B) 6]|nr:putative membrane protein [Parabacteroides distasonis str. 3999B T(B) 6]
MRLEKVGSDSGLFLLVPIGVFYCFMSYSYISFDYFIKIKSI